MTSTEAIEIIKKTQEVVANGFLEKIQSLGESIKLIRGICLNMDETFEHYNWAVLDTFEADGKVYGTQSGEIIVYNIEELDLNVLVTALKEIEAERYDILQEHESAS